MSWCDNEDGRRVDIYGLPSIPNSTHFSEPFTLPPKKHPSPRQRQAINYLFIHIYSAKKTRSWSWARKATTNLTHNPICFSLTKVITYPFRLHHSHPAFIMERPTRQLCRDNDCFPFISRVLHELVTKIWFCVDAGFSRRNNVASDSPRFGN